MKSMHRLVRLGLLTITLFTVHAEVQAIPIVRFDPSTVTLGQGDTISVDLLVDEAVDLFALNLSISFDPAVVNVVSVLEGNILGSGGGTFFIPGNIDNSTGLLSFMGNSLIGDTSGVNGSGVLAHLSFSGIGIGISNLLISDLLLLDSAFSDMNAIAQPGTLTVSTTVPEPSPVALLLAALIGTTLARSSRTKRPQR